MKVLKPEVKDLLDIYVRPNIGASETAEYLMKVCPEFAEYKKKPDSLRKLIDNYKKKYKEKIYVEKTDDKKIGELGWKEAIKVMADMQALKKKASWSQFSGEIKINTNTDYIIVMMLSDMHLGSMSCDLKLMDAYTDLILNVPNLYIALLGDGTDNFVSAAKGSGAIFGQIIDPTMQHELLLVWVMQVLKKILFTTWSNHAEFEEKASGMNHEKETLSHNTLYLDGMGQIKLWLNDILYQIGATHKTVNHSKDNPLHGAYKMAKTLMRYADIVAAGDKHTSAIGVFGLGADTIYCSLSGTFKVDDIYSMRYHGNFTQTTMPCYVLNTKTKEIVPFWNIRNALRYAGVDADKTLIEKVRERSNER